MRFFTRLTNGWKICLNSFAILNENKRLLFFPLLSCISLLLILGSFVTLALGAAGWHPDNIGEKGMGIGYAILFGYYLVNCFVLLFFNTALMYCSRVYFTGGTVSVADGLRFGLSRIAAIFSWAVLSATVGILLRIIQGNAGFLGKIITGTIGVVWSIATFFVVPVIAYENAGPLEAFKRSSQIMKQKWGESLGATFGFGIIQFIAILLVATPMFIMGLSINFYIGLILAALASFSVIAILGAAQIIFISAVYHNINGANIDVANINGAPAKHFNRQLPDQLFIHK